MPGRLGGVRAGARPRLPALSESCHFFSGAGGVRHGWSVLWRGRRGLLITPKGDSQSAQGPESPQPLQTWKPTPRKGGDLAVTGLLVAFCAPSGAWLLLGTSSGLDVR